MMKNKKLLILIAILVIVGIGILVMRGSGIAVEQIEPEHMQVTKTVSASGRVVSESEADLAFQVPGQVLQIFVKENNFITKGTAVAAVSNSGQYSDLQVARSNKDVAQKDLDLYLEDTDNVELAGGEDEYWINVRRLEDLLNKANASYQSQIASFAKTYIYAPFDGTVADIYKKPGEYVGAGEAVVKFGNLEKLLFETEIDQEDFGLLKQGQEVEITLDTNDGKEFKGSVDVLPGSADPETDNFVVKLMFVNGENAVYLGATGDAKIVIESTPSDVQALTFDQVLQDEEGKNFVWILENGKLKKLFVEIGLEGDLYTEIKTDLSGYTLVTSDKTADFKEGMKANASSGSNKPR